jgi:hypothetical protein
VPRVFIIVCLLLLLLCVGVLFFASSKYPCVLVLFLFFGTYLF